MKKIHDALIAFWQSLPVRTLRVHAGRSVRGIAAPSLLLCLLVAAAILLAGLRAGWKTQAPTAEALSRLDNAYYLALRQKDGDSQTNTEQIPVLGDSVFSANVILLDITEDRVLCVKEPDARAYPASLTKMMTVLIALENCPNLYAEYTLEQNIFDYLKAENASTAGFLAGEEVTLIDLMYGALLPSGSEAAIGLARYVSGSEQAFVTLMNQKAAAIGMDSTHFTNVTGLHSDEQYTTARDMAKLMQYALQNQRFLKIITTTRYSTYATNLHPSGFTMYSTVYNAFRQSEREMGYIRGGKTGFTPEAGQCLASYAVRDGHEYVLVTMGAGSGSNTTAYHIYDADALIDLYAVVAQ